MRFSLLLLFLLCCILPVHLHADTDPAAPYFIRSATGFGTIQRGLLSTLPIEVGSSPARAGKARIIVRSDSTTPVETLINFDSSVVVPIDISRLQRAPFATITVEFLRENNTVITEAQRKLAFSWGNVGVRLDSASQAPFTTGTAARLRLIFTKPTMLESAVNEFSIALQGANTANFYNVYDSTVIPDEFTVIVPDTASLGTSIVVTTSFDAEDLQTAVSIPMIPAPIQFISAASLENIGTNNYGPIRSAYAGTVPSQTSVFTLSGLPDHTVGVVFASMLHNGDIVPFDSVVAPAATYLQKTVAKQIDISNLDVRSDFVLARVYVQDIPQPFDQVLSVSFDLGHPRVNVTLEPGKNVAFQLRRWNPHNNGTGTLRPDTTQTVKLEWAVKSIDSLRLTFFNTSGLPLGTRRIPSLADGASCLFTLNVQNIPQGTTAISVVAFSDEIAPEQLRWDTTIAILPAFPAFLFQRHSEFTSSGLQDVNDVLTLADLPPDVQWVRLRLADADSNITYMDSTAVVPSVPYSGDVLFSSQTRVRVPMLVQSDTIRSVGFFVRSYHTDPLTLLRWQHPQGDLVVSIANDGSIKAKLGADSMVCSGIVRDGSWKHVAVVVRDTGVALFLNGSPQGIFPRKAWATMSPSTRSVFLGDSTNTDDSLFAAAGLNGWKEAWGFEDLQRLQVLEGKRSSALFSYPMNDAIATSSSTVTITDGISSAQQTISNAVIDSSAAFAYAQFHLNDIGMWRVQRGSVIAQPHGVNGYITVMRNNIEYNDTIPSLVQLQTTFLSPDSVRCAKAYEYDTRLSATEGWGPFNSYERILNVFTYQGGFTWGQVAASPAVRKDGFAVYFRLYDRGRGKVVDSARAYFTIKEVEAKPKAELVTITAPRALRMEFVNSENFYVTSGTNISLEGILDGCLEIAARIDYEPPPPIPVMYSRIGPFRQSKIYQAQKLMNTYYAFTVEEAESNVVFTVANDDGEVIKTIPATKVRPGVWKASVDMADCDPPRATVVANAYKGKTFVNASTPQYFAITANRPSWLSEKDNVEWRDPFTSDGKPNITAIVTTGPILDQLIPNDIPIIGGTAVFALPTSIMVQLQWDTVTNVLTLADGYNNKIETPYNTFSDVSDAFQDLIYVINNVQTATRTIVQAAVPFIQQGLKNVPTVSASTSSSIQWSMKLDKYENLDVLSLNKQGVSLEIGLPGKSFEKPLFQVTKAIEEGSEGGVSFVVALTFTPVIDANGAITSRVNVGSDEQGWWGPRGTLPVTRDTLTDPSLQAGGLSIGGGVAITLDAVKGAASITATFTVNLDGAEAFAITLDKDRKSKSTRLRSLGVDVRVLVQGALAWGLVTKTLYGPHVLWSHVLAGADLEDYYPSIKPDGKPAERVEQIDHTSHAAHALQVLNPLAAPSPHSAQGKGVSCITWIDQDHRTGIGTLNVGVRKHGRADVSAIHRVETNGNSMVSPQISFLTDSTVVVVWSELDVDRTNSTADIPFIQALRSSDVRWAVVNIDRGVVMSGGEFAFDRIDGKPSVTRLTDTSAVVVWVSVDSTQTDAMIAFSVLHGTDGTMSATDLRTVHKSTHDHRTPQVSPGENGTALCTWIDTDSTISRINTSTFDGESWSAPTSISIEGFSVNYINVDDGGKALMASGHQSGAGNGHERVYVIPRAPNGGWDDASAIPIPAFDAEGMLQHPRISVRGDSAFIMARAFTHLSGKLTSATHKFPTAVVDLRTRSMGNGTWVATDSLSLIHDYDMQWEADGIHVIAQEHLPVVGLHANGLLKRPLGSPMMDLGMHTVPISNVITGLTDDDRTTVVEQRSLITMEPSPATGRVKVRGEQEFTSLVVYSFDGALVGSMYQGEPTTSTMIDVGSLSPGSYILIMETDLATPIATILRVAPR
ncbi:MAG: hypothetical protein JSS89_09895 [Bacteroidetes bacterium]|nr:hypothetical protein [Bacteroidota bacterium]